MGDHLRPCDLEKQFSKIIEDATSTPVDESELYLPAVTNVNRDKWAEGREKYFGSGSNKESLRAIENAAFIVTFSDKDVVFKEDVIDSGKSSIICFFNPQIFVLVELRQSHKLAQINYVPYEESKI